MLKTVKQEDILYKLRYEPPPIGTVLSLTDKIPEGNTGIILDNSPYGNHGTITGATWVRLPSGLWVLDLDGTDDLINCGNNVSLQLQNFTAKIWVRFDAVEICAIFSKDAMNTGLGGWEFIQDAGGRISAIISDDAAYDYAPGNVGDVTTGIWYHLVMTVDASWVIVYINGVQTTYIARTKTISYANSLKIGEASVGASYALNGQIVLAEHLSSVWTGAQVLDSKNQEHHLFGV